MIEPGGILAALIGVTAILIRRPYARLVAGIWSERLRFRMHNAERFIQAGVWVIGMIFIAAGIGWQISSL